MLKFLRGSRRTKLVWWLVIVGTVVGFIVGFSFFQGVGGRSEGRGTGVVGAAAGQAITQQELDTAYALLTAQFAQQYRRDPQAREASMLKEQAWLQLVTEKALVRIGRQIGFGASDSEVVHAMRFTPPPTVLTYPAFQTNGRFDPQKYAAALADPRTNWWSIPEQELRSTLPAQKVQERLLAASKVSQSELLRSFQDRYDQARVTVARWLPSPAPVDTTKVTDAMVEDYYRQHPGLFSGPVEANAVVVVMPKTVAPVEDAVAREQAMSVVRDARAGSDFAELARTYSAAPNADQGGELGRDFGAAELGPELSSKVGAVVDSAVLDPIREGTRYFVMQVRRVPAAGPEPRFRLRQIMLPIAASDSAREEDQKRLEGLQAAARREGLGPAAAARGLASRETGWINSSSFSPELFTAPQAHGFALTAKVGAVSPIYDLEDNWLLVQVKGRHEEGLRPLEDVRPQVKGMVLQRLRLEEPRRQAERALAAMRAGQDFEAAARASGAAAVEATGAFTRLQPAPQLGGSKLAAGMAFALPVGQVGGPLTGASAVLLLRKDADQPASPAMFDSVRASLEQSLLSARRSRDLGAWLEWVRATSRMKDNRGDALAGR